MHDWVEKLLILQERDLRIARLREMVDSVPAEKKKAEDLQAEALAELDAVKSHVIDVEKQIKSVEIKVESLRAKELDFQAKSAMIKNNEEYRAALTQIEKCQHDISVLEEQELELMEELESGRELLSRKKKAVDAAKLRVAERLGDLDKRTTNCEAQLKTLLEQRTEALADVPKDVIRKYERLRTSKRRVSPRVFVPISDETCGGCHMKVTAQVRMNARKGQPVTCEICGLMLYDEG